ncbi:MAG TPA: prepilin-type N-terminal cleavage/methylation domain-containing protein [Planctomycetota bacterium]|nr:prepilin-type N-terminal cleavage/methylation domain-containing protein [Planctomycetota bacterium]
MAATDASRTGFTLIELLIAVSLGMVLCLTAYAGVRSSAQAVTVTTRMSLENALLRDGVLAALDDLDTWGSLDHPADAALRPLRGAGSPFAPLSLDGLPVDPDQARQDSWFNGDPNHGNSQDGGDFALLGTAAEPGRSWRHVLLQRVASQLGYYALIDYAPANMIFARRDETGAPDPEFFDCWAASPGAFYSPNHADNTNPRDFVGITRGTMYTVSAEPAFVADGVHRRYYRFWDYPVTGTVPFSQDAFRRAGQRLALLPLRAAHWPALSVTTRRFILGYRRWQTGTVVLADPLTGAQSKLFVATTTTTLRGARRMRPGIGEPGDPP